MKWWKAISFPFRLSVVFGWQVKKEKKILCFDKTSPHNHCNVGYWLSKIWVALKRAGVLSSLSCSLHVFFIWRRCLFGFWFLVSCSDLSSYFPRFSSISLEGDKSSSGTSNFLQNAAFGMMIIYNIMKLDILVRLRSSVLLCSTFVLSRQLSFKFYFTNTNLVLWNAYRISTKQNLWPNGYC